MSPAHIEQLVHRSLARARDGLPAENGTIEFKAEWPTDHRKVARRIAGHCNAALADVAVWVIGAADNGSAQTLGAVNAAQWWSQVQSFFEGTPPRLLDVLPIQTQGKEITALVFDARQRPYAWKSSHSGLPGSEAISVEVPWREGSMIRSARREEILRSFVPAVSVPEVEVRSCEISHGRKKDSDSPSYRWSGHLLLYVVPASDSRIVLPLHRCNAVLKTDTGVEVVEFPALSNGTDRAAATLNGIKRGLVRSTATEYILDGPGSVWLDFWQGSLPSRYTRDRVLHSLHVELGFARLASPVFLTVDLPAQVSSEEFTYWNREPYVRTL
jgi:hypothetical protein